MFRPSLSRSSASIRGVRALASVAVVSLAVACGESTTEPGGESEVISRVTITLTPTGGGTPITAFIDDADGSGPAAPSAQVGALALTRGVNYTGSVKFENRLKNPAEDITAEVRAEANEHRVFYTVTGSGVSVATTDLDPQNRALGTLFTKSVTADATVGAGTMRVVLCHYGASPKVGSATSCTGDTDIDVTFAISVAGAL